MYESEYTPAEELANTLTHGLGILLSVIGMIILLQLSAKSGSFWHLASFTAYGISLILLYTSSTLYHALPQPRLKRMFKIADHACIYLLIAGSYTPFMLVSLKGSWGWGMFIAIWIIAFCGVIFKLFYTGKLRKISLTIYLLMGWLAIIVLPGMMKVLPAEALLWILAGGLFYSFGTFFYVWKKLPFNHAIWHLFVLAGSASHYLAILWYVVPREVTTL